MAVNLKTLASLEQIEKVIIHSITTSCYQVSVLLDGEEVFLVDKKGRLLSHHNIAGLQALFENLPVQSLVLRHQSAYDEMVGQPLRDQANTLEVPLSRRSWGSVPERLR